jgi:hypothetical protein
LSRLSTFDGGAQAGPYDGLMHRGGRALLAIIGIVGIVTALPLLLRRRLLDYGSTPSEAAHRLPGDELLPDADLVATRAITIEAPPSDVWPWLVQLGNGRAGAYSYDILDRLMGLDIHSSRRIVPELQDLAVGEIIPVANDGTGLRVHRLEAPHVLATRTDDGTWVWAWVLEPVADGTRLLSRTRMETRSASLLQRISTSCFLVPASWLMERKMLQGIRDRAEGLTAHAGA